MLIGTIFGSATVLRPFASRFQPIPTLLCTLSPTDIIDVGMARASAPGVTRFRRSGG